MPRNRPVRRCSIARSLGALAAAAAMGVLVLGTLVGPVGAQDGAGQPASETTPAKCTDQKSVLTGTANPEQAKTYHLFPFDVPKGTARIEIGYRWDPVDEGVIDIGVWDNHGTKGPQAFRSWAGSRQGRIDKGTAPLVIAPDRNERTVIARPVEAGTWHVELGYAAVDSALNWQVEIRCVAGEQAKPLADDPVDPTFVVKDQPGWYAGDFHLHAYHSSPNGPDPDTMVAKAKAAGLDIVPVTEYVTDAHWVRLGKAQRDHPDVLIWPGREVITYFGHMIVLNETPDVMEHRVGYQGITENQIAKDSAADGGLVQLAHPTIYPPDVFGSACRGCFTENVDDLDFANFTSLEVVTDGSIVELGGAKVPNPFVRTTIELWERKLREGHRLTAISGSDNKSGDGYGSTSTMVYAKQLSRPAVDEAIRRGHTYVRGLGKDSPTMEVKATSPGGASGMFGDTLVSDTATLTYDVKGGNGQVLAIRRNGTEVNRVPITSDDFTFEVAATRTPDEGPLGTFWGAEVLDTTRFAGSEVATIVANPVFLASKAAAEPHLPTFSKPSSAASPATASSTSDSSDVGPWLIIGASALVLAIGVGVVVWRRRRSRTTSEETEQISS